MQSRPVGIIGAGPAGLAVAAALKARGLAFEILDAGEGFGGIWDIDRAETPMYDSAHFISSRTLSALPGHPMPAGFPDYPRHDQILDYLRGFAREHDLEPHARFGRRVTAARRAGDGDWTVETDDGTEHRVRAVCAAVGTNWHPVMPELPGTFHGTAFHSFDYRSPEVFRDRRVLVVGGGNSGCDIACDAATSARRAFISLRRGYHFVPKYIFGRPADVFAHEGPPLPGWLERRVFGFLLRRVLVGDLTRFGLPAPDHALLESHPILNTRLLHHLGHGDLEVRPDVAALHGSEVEFADGRREEIDVVVWATGYRKAIPFLAPEVLDLDAGAGDLYLQTAHRRIPDLFVLGLFETDGAAYPLLGLQGRLVAAALDPALPPRRRDEWDRRRAGHRPDLRGGRRYLDSPRHTFYVHADSYHRALDAEVARLQ